MILLSWRLVRMFALGRCRGQPWRQPVSARTALAALLIAVTVPAVNAGAQDFTGHVPALNAKVTSLRFFETPPPPNVIPRERRVYSSRFDRSQVRRIYWELNLEHPAPGRRVNFSIDAVIFYVTDGSEGHRTTMTATLQPSWTWSYWHNGGYLTAQRKVWKSDGSSYLKTEPWPAGAYRVDVYIGGKRVASSGFEITDRSSSARGGASSGGTQGDKRAAEAAYKEADRLTEQLKFREAIPLLDKAIQLDPNLLTAYALRGYTYSVLSSLENKPEYRRRALRDYTTAIENDLKHGLRRSGWYNSRGVIYMAENDDRRALQDFNEAVSLSPKSADILSNRGELRRRMGDLDGSIADLTRVIELEPKVGQRYCQRGLTWLRKRKDDAAQDDFRRCADLDPKTRQQYTKYIDRALEDRGKPR